jgi:RHS repeat-associated protein
MALHLPNAWTGRWVLLALLVSNGLWVEPSRGQSPSTTLVTTVLKPAVLQGDQVTALSVSEQRQAYAATDGFGRPVQAMQLRQAPDQADVVSFQQYNQFGNDGKAYLPFTRPHATGGVNGLYLANPLPAQAAFYQGTDRVAHESGPLYTAARQETSPLGRVMATTPAGSAWSQHPTTQFSSSNAASSIHRWQLSAGSLLDGDAYYDAQQLLQVNSTDADGRQQQTYRDLRGQVVLVRRLADGETFDTYTVYDEAGRVRYTVPPAAVRELTGSWVITDQAFVDRWLYQYAYDEQGRPVGRRVPGAGWSNTVYDAYDRPFLIQDANRSSESAWFFTKYDEQGRAIAEGLWYDNTGRSRATLQQDVDALTGSGFEQRTHTGHYSTKGAFPVMTEGSDGYVLTERFYDDYDPTGDGTTDFQFRSLNAQSVNIGGTMPQPTTHTAGFPTVTRKRVVNSDGTYGAWLATATFYDQYSNVVQHQSTSLLNLNESQPNITTLIYREQGFVPQLLRSIKQQQSTQFQNVTVYNRFAYDHAGRLLKVWQQNEWGTRREPEVLVAQYAYNALGQVVEKNLHSRDSGTRFLQSVDMRYDLHGALSSINNSELTNDGKFNDDDNDVFGMAFIREANDAQVSNAPRYDGGLSAVRWQTHNARQTNQPERERSYVFAYDGLGRLQDAVFAARDPQKFFDQELDAYSERGITYDANGNLLSVVRNSQASDNITTQKQIDDLQYTYSGNRLLQVEDAVQHPLGFDDHGQHGTVEYSYDDNGNVSRDENKQVSYEYNALNKVAAQSSPNGVTRYIYDAAGTVLRREVENQTTGKTTLFHYVDGAVYEENPTYKGLTSLPSPEGRVVVAGQNPNQTQQPSTSTYNPDQVGPAQPTQPPTGPHLVYEYHLRDHLGNLRVAFRAESGTEQQHLQLEPSMNEEGAYPRFANVSTTRTSSRAKEGSYSASVTANQNGPTTRIPVADGDRLKVDLFYSTPSGTQTGSAIARTATRRIPAVTWAVAPLLLPMPNGKLDGQNSRPATATGWWPGVQFSVTGLLSRAYQQKLPSTDGSLTPSAVPPTTVRLDAAVRWTLYRQDNATVIATGTAVMPVTGASTANWDHFSANIPVDLSSEAARTGYLQVSLMNDGAAPVYFDSVTIRHPQASLLISQEHHYYPFGLGMQGVAINTPLGEAPSKDRYNGGSQLQDELLEGDAADYSTFYRRYDPALGRFLGVDPMADSYADMAPYQFAGNDPVNFNDPSGAVISMDAMGRMTMTGGRGNDFFFRPNMDGPGSGGGGDSGGGGGGNGIGMGIDLGISGLVPVGSAANIFNIYDAWYKAAKDAKAEKKQADLATDAFNKALAYWEDIQPNTARSGNDIPNATNFFGLPSFSAINSNYLGDEFSVSEVYKIIGGLVLQNYARDPKGYANTCALRISYALNASGAPIPFIDGQTGSGDDGSWYFYRVADLHTYMDKTYGGKDLSNVMSGSKRSDFTGYTGIIQFDLRFRNATGHFTTWNGNSVGHGDYFSQTKSIFLYLFP